MDLQKQFYPYILQNHSDFYEFFLQVPFELVEDIVDTLTGDKPIGAAGTEAPNYYHQGEITWKNRRNQ